MRFMWPFLLLILMSLSTDLWQRVPVLDDPGNGNLGEGPSETGRHARGVGAHDARAQDQHVGTAPHHVRNRGPLCKSAIAVWSLARIRSSVMRIMSIAMRELRLRIVSKSCFPISSTVHSVVVRTVAERGAF